MWIHIIYHSISTRYQNAKYQKQFRNQLTASIHYTSKLIQSKSINMYWVLSGCQEASHQEDISKRRQHWVSPHSSQKAVVQGCSVTLPLCRAAHVESDNVWSFSGVTGCSCSHQRRQAHGLWPPGVPCQLILAPASTSCITGASDLAALWPSSSISI